MREQHRSLGDNVAGGFQPQGQAAHLGSCFTGDGFVGETGRVRWLKQTGGGNDD